MGTLFTLSSKERGLLAIGMNDDWLQSREANPSLLEGGSLVGRHPDDNDLLDWGGDALVFGPRVGQRSHLLSGRIHRVDRGWLPRKGSNLE